MPRTILLRNWLHHIYSSRHPEQDIPIEPASADASFRRYFRIYVDDGQTKIVMDAPPQHEDCRPFLKVAKLFRDAGVHVPEIYAEDLGQGFLLLSDLGQQTYLSQLSTETARPLYEDANQALIAIQQASQEGILPEYDEHRLLMEMQLFPEWYLKQHLNLSLSDEQQQLLDSTFAAILKNNLSQPKTFVHRDFHSRNLMVVDAHFPQNPGVLDFQDAVYGPITYDLVSLYRDAYISWEEEMELDFVIRYWEKAKAAGLPVRANFDDFYRDYEWMGAQRQLKVIGIFARLFHRDSKDGYLKDIPRVMAYLKRTANRYTELAPLAHLLNEIEGITPSQGLTF